MATSFKRSMHTMTHSLPRPCSRPLPTHTSAGVSWTLTGKSGQSLVGSLLLSPGSWSAQRFVCAPKEPVCPVPCKFWWLSGGVTPPRGLLPHPGLLYPEPLPLQQATTDWYPLIRHSNTQRQVWFSLCGVSWCTQGFV